MKIRKLTIVIVVLTAIITLIVISAFRQQAQNKPQATQEEATEVRRGQVTEKEREYSREYKKLYADRNGQKLTEISERSKRRGNKQEAGVSIGIPMIPTVGNSSMPTASEFLKDLSCKADAVVVGSVVKKSAHLTDDETFVFTEYEFSVEEVLKNNLIFSIEPNKSIQVTRPGGLIKLDDQLIRVEDKSYQPLQIKKKYLLFLNFIPAADGYIVSSVKGDFILENDSFKKLSVFPLAEELEKGGDPRVLLNNVRNSISVDCNQTFLGDTK
jgi:uncharacterized metal-binding protein YceD (DUF177 family)